MNTSAVADPFGTEAWLVATFAYDCVIALAIALSRSTDFNNGAEVAERFREARFDGASGRVEFDTLGDRETSTINCTSLRIAPVTLWQRVHAHGTVAHPMSAWLAPLRRA
jgi:hypothetical protein